MLSVERSATVLKINGTIAVLYRPNRLITLELGGGGPGAFRPDLTRAMFALDRFDTQNRLLRQLPESELHFILQSAEPVELTRNFVICRAGGPIDYAYFPSSGVGSVVTVTADGHTAETGMFGREGFAPTSALVGGGISVHDVVIHVEGHGHRVQMEYFSEALRRGEKLSDLLARFMQCLLSQVAYTALCNVANQIDERLARWLLMFHDRVDSDEMNLTHDAISAVLGVRRPSITTALHVLEGKRLIRAERGLITLRDRVGLEAYVGESYGVPEMEYRRLIGEF